MDASLIDPFISSVLNVISTMARVDATAGKPYLKTDRATSGVITGIIGMSSDELRGSLLLSFDESAILKIVSNMLGETYAAVDEQVVDAVGELTNIICGSTKTEFGKRGIRFDLATPVMVKGKGVEIVQLKRELVMSVPFETPDGRFYIEANLEPINRNA